tara:strand:+ start:319 stop:1005 length:687 start_codon:yes stop_codon:yes gene_type:complete
MSNSKPFTCPYCGASFTREKTLAVHMCEKKRRHFQKDERRVQLGYLTFNRFYKLCQKAKENKTYEQFCDSPYYNAFVKFGSFVNNVRPLYPEKYVDYVVTSGVRLDHWCREEMYERYALELILKENVETALERSVKTMMDWGDDKEARWQDYFNYASLNRVCQDIKDGKVSPWLILNCKTGKDMLGKMNDEQLQIVYHVMQPNHWAMRFKRGVADVELVKEIVKEAGL